MLGHGELGPGVVFGSHIVRRVRGRGRRGLVKRLAWLSGEGGARGGEFLSQGWHGSQDQIPRTVLAITMCSSAALDEPVKSQPNWPW